jgi:peptide/nickel transport system permease protein
MTRYIAEKLASAIGVLLILVLFVFILGRVIPGDPVRLMVGARATTEAVEAKRRELGMDQTLPVQFVTYITGLSRGELQTSLRTRRPVLTDLLIFFPATAELIIFSLLLAVIGGACLGLSLVGEWRGAGSARLLLLTGSAIPVFLLGMICILVFYRYLSLLPATGRISIRDWSPGPTGFFFVDAILGGRMEVAWNVFRHLLLPGFCLALAPAVAIGRMFRSTLTASMRADYIRTARSKGLREREIILRHAVRNSLGPVLSIGGLQVAILFGNVVIVELIFAWPGIGLYTAQSIVASDYPAIAGVTLVLGSVYILMNALVEVLQAWADPRLRSF